APARPSRRLGPRRTTTRNGAANKPAATKPRARSTTKAWSFPFSPWRKLNRQRSCVRLFAKLGRRHAHDLLERFREVKRVAEIEFLDEFLKTVAALVNRRASAIDLAALLKLAGRRAGFERELLAEIVVVEADAAGDLLRRQPALFATVGEQALR